MFCAEIGGKNCGDASTVNKSDEDATWKSVNAHIPSVVHKSIG